MRAGMLWGGVRGGEAELRGGVGQVRAVVDAVCAAFQVHPPPLLPAVSGARKSERDEGEAGRVPTPNTGPGARRQG
eukprot:1217719-Rhodomonas_salina.1